jgi:hypothetical protein
MTEFDDVPVRRIGQLQNSRHELFAQGLFQGKSAIQAYEDAGYTRNVNNASRLRGTDKVKARLAEFHARTVQSVNLTKEFVIDNLMGIVRDARSLDDFAGANRALHLLGLEMGLFVERKEIGAPGAFDGLTIAGKRERVLFVAKQLGLVHLYSDETQRRLKDGASLKEVEPGSEP